MADAVYTLGITGPQSRASAIDHPSHRGRSRLTLGGWPKWRRWVLGNGAVDAVYLLGITGAPKPALPRSTSPPYACGRRLTLSGWPKMAAFFRGWPKMTASGFRERGGRCGRLTMDPWGPAKKTALPLSTSPPDAGGLWLTLGGWPNGGGGFRKRGGRCGIPTRGRCGPKNKPALPLSTSPSNAGGRWLTLGRRPK